MKDNYTRVGASVNDWAASLRKVGLHNIADRLQESHEIKIQGLSTLKSLNLPRLNNFNMPLDLFLSDFEANTGKLNCNKYYVSLRSGHKGKSRVRAIDLDKKQLLKFIHDNVRDSEISDYVIILFEYYENIYGGNIVWNRTSGKLLIELVEGTHGEIITGEKSPSIIAEWDTKINYPKIYRIYKGDKVILHDKKIRKAIIKTIAYLTKPGYYEFTLTMINGNLEPIFLDFRDKMIYQIDL